MAKLVDKFFNRKIEGELSMSEEDISANGLAKLSDIPEVPENVSKVYEIEDFENIPTDILNVIQAGDTLFDTANDQVGYVDVAYDDEKRIRVFGNDNEKAYTYWYPYYKSGDTWSLYGATSYVLKGGTKLYKHEISFSGFNTKIIMFSFRADAISTISDLLIECITCLSAYKDQNGYRYSVFCHPFYVRQTGANIETSNKLVWYDIPYDDTTQTVTMTTVGTNVSINKDTVTAL